MKALSDLTTEVRFRERMRGYDYTEVDEYVKAVNRSALHAMEQLAELQERLRRADAGQPPGDDNGDARETLVRTLVLAQRTADVAVAEARAEAEAITAAAQASASKTMAEADADADARVRSAEDKASQIMAEGEENCRLIIAETKRTAAIEIAAERERWAEELRGMQDAKADMEATSARIRARLEDERAQLHQIMASFCTFVDEVAPNAGSDEPGSQTAVHEVHEGEVHEGSEQEHEDEPDEDQEEETPAAADRDESRDESDQPPSVDPLPGSPATGPLTTAAAADEPAPDPEAQPESEHAPGRSVFPDEDVAVSDGVDDSDDEAASEPAPGLLSVPELPMVKWLDESATPDDADVAGRRVPASSGPAEPAPRTAAPMAAATHAWPVLGDEAAGLFDVDAGEDEEFIEQLRRVVSSDAPLPDSEAAMSAFFNHDEGAFRGGGRGRSSSLRRTADPVADPPGPGAQ